MDKVKYLEMCYQFGDEVDENKMPPDLEDLPNYVERGMEIFNLLADVMISTASGPILYSSKDYSNFDSLCDMLSVGVEDKLKVLDVVKYIDGRVAKKARKSLPRK